MFEISEDLINLSAELTEMSEVLQTLRHKVIVQTANIQAYESNLFKLCVTSFYNEVHFVEEREVLIEKIKDSEYCDSVYSEVSSKGIKFYDNSDCLLIEINLGQFFESEQY